MKNENRLVISDSLVPDIFLVRYLPELSRNAIIAYLYINMDLKGKSFTEKELKDFSIMPDKDVYEVISELLSKDLIDKKGEEYVLSDIKKIEIDEYIKTQKAKGEGDLGLTSDENRRAVLADSINNTFYGGRMANIFYRLVDKCLWEYGFDDKVCYGLFSEGDRRKISRSYNRMEKLAEEWYNKGYVTVDKLEPYLERNEEKDKLVALMRKTLRININALDEERIHGWVDKFCFGEDMVIYAIKKNEYRGKITVLNVDDTLAKWFENGCDTVEKAEAFESEQFASNKRKYSKRKAKADTVWKSGSEAGIDKAAEEETKPADETKQLPDDVLGMFGGDDDDD
ncbi:MAG: DnaD domain protein [Saccharofermentans sp.]|nr:DnaD domain protein [Saccharofermentans sp.]